MPAIILKGPLVKFGLILFSALLGFASTVALARAAEEPNEDFLKMVVGLLAEKDKDLRAVGLDQVRKEAKGESATKRFAAQLPKLQPTAQVGLLAALADRGDAAARPAVVELLAANRDESVRSAALATLGVLGEPGDLPLLLIVLAGESKAEQASARKSLTRLKGANVSLDIAKGLANAPAPLRVTLIVILTDRRAADAVPVMLPFSAADDPKVRAAAMTALAQLAQPEHLPALLQGVLKAESGNERNAAERAVAAVCGRIAEPDKRAELALAVIAQFDDKQQTALIPTLGRIGGPQALSAVEAAIASKNLARRQAGLQALGKWPNASVADRLLELSKAAKDDAERTLTLQAFTRLCATRDKRTDQERLARMKQAWELAKTEAEKKLVIDRARTAYVVESLRFVLPLLADPALAEKASETVVELAHHRELREPNKAEFERALTQVQKNSRDPVVLERARRYKLGETWLRPKAAEPQ